MNTYDYSVYIGRFSPIHCGHVRSIQIALEVANKAIIMIGSANAPRDLRNPFTDNERAKMIRSCFTDEENKRILIGMVQDYYYQNHLWLTDVQTQVNAMIASQGWTDRPPSVVLVGHKKDHTSTYLDDFKHWNSIETENYESENVELPTKSILSATDIRNLYFSGKHEFISSAVKPSVNDFLLKFMNTSEYELLKEEYETRLFEENQYAGVPEGHSRNCYTADAVVIQSGHVLLIQRGQDIGKGLWALPGGHVKSTETSKETSIRELIEETSIKLQPNVLERSIRDFHLFDHPERSLRFRVLSPKGRTVTVAYYMELDSSKPLPRVKAADDAIDVRWVPLGDLPSLKNKMFEDHASIINYFIYRHNLS